MRHSQMSRSEIGSYLKCSDIRSNFWYPMKWMTRCYGKRGSKTFLSTSEVLVSFKGHVSKAELTGTADGIYKANPRKKTAVTSPFYSICRFHLATQGIHQFSNTSDDCYFQMGKLKTFVFAPSTMWKTIFHPK